MKISPARVAAFNVLLRIEVERSFSSILLPVYESGLAANDRSLCHELVLGSLRRQMYLDAVIDRFSKGKKLDAVVRVALRLGLYQLLFLDRVPDHSAVNESVNLVQMAKKTSAKGFVNALLRRAARENVKLAFDDDIGRLSIETSHPRWLIDRWIHEFGEQETASLAAANNEIGEHAFRLLRGVPLENGRFRPSDVVEGCYLTRTIDNDLIALAESDAIYFQDEGSQMIASAVEVPDRGSFLDVCAAPGGKTGLVARRNHSMTRVAVAGDLHWQRVAALRDNCRRQDSGPINVIQYNAENTLPFSEMSFDAVLVDAPCSGTGTIRHNPELRYFLTSSDIVELSRKQLNILQNASKLVRPMGSLIYSTCSLETEENEKVCREFLNGGSGFELVKPKVPDKFITGEGFARMFPHRDGMDGFFVAAFRKK